jgi:hypothetical protein
MASFVGHRIDIAALKRGKYRVEYAGEVLLDGSTEPLAEACRELLARGFTGRLEMWGGDSYPRMIVDIEHGARLTVADDRGLRFAKHKTTEPSEPIELDEAA